jgi:hypothetical protein
LPYIGKISQDVGTTDTPDKKSSDDEAKKKSNRKKMFKDLLQMRITNPETGNKIKIDTAMDYKKTHPAHRIAREFIRQRMMGVSNRAGVPKNSGPK